MRGQRQTTRAPCRKRSVAGTCLSLFALATVAGCKVGPNFTHPTVSVNAQWSAAGDSRITTQTDAERLWWKTFQDPVLDRLIEQAFRQNLPLQVAGLRIVEARARWAVATGRLFPQTQAAFGGVSAVGVPQQFARGLGFNRNLGTYQLGFDAIWEPDFWGKYRRGVESEAASLLASVADYQSGIVSLTAEVARIYTLVRTFEELIALAEQNAKLQEDSLRIAESRFHNGATSELDVSQATALLESTRASIPQLHIDLIQAHNALTTLLGQPTGTVGQQLDGSRQIPKAPATVALSVPTEMLRRRPDIRSAELNAAAQCARIGIAKSELYPSFSLVGAFGLWANTTGNGSKNLFSADSIFYGFGPRVNWPILNYGRLTNNVRVQDARFQQALVSYRNTVLEAAQEVEDALAGFLRSGEAIVSQERSVAAAQRSQEIAVVQYREGAVDYQRVLDAQRFLLQQQNSLTQIRSAAATNLIAVYKALGGGWEVRDGQPVIPDATRKEMKARTDWGDLLSEPRKPEHQHTPSTGRK